MIKGAIDVAQRSRVAGWIHSSSETLRGRTVLAFVGERCVGAGEVDGFRQDLLNAQIGDGYCGFDFPVMLADDEPVGALVVRPQFSDAALLQASSIVVGRDDEDRSAGPDFGAIPPGCVSWMMDHGMLEQHECDFLRAIHAVGVYERSLRTARRGAGQPSSQRTDPETAARDLMSVLMMADMRPVRTRVQGISDITPLPRPMAPVMALWSQDRGRISVEERSHLAAPGVAGASPSSRVLPGGLDYGYGPDRLLFLHRDCRFAARGPAPASGLVVLTAAPAEKAPSLAIVTDSGEGRGRQAAAG